MTKLVLTDIGSTLTNTAATQINANNDAIVAAVENTLSRDGSTPNQMGADIDMDGNDLLNVNRIDVESLFIDGEGVQSVNIATALKISNNLSDVDDVAASRTNLGLGTAATQPSTAFATAAQGVLADGAAQKAQNLADLAAPKTALLNLGLDAYPVSKYGSIIVGDNSAVINAAIDAAFLAGGGTVILPPGTTQASAIILKDRVRLVPSGRGSTLLNIGTETYFLRAEGSLGAGVNLSANASAGATQLTIISTTGIVAGDYLVISDGFSYAATDATYKSGETVQVASVDSGTQLTLVGKLYGSNAPGNAYTTANSAKVQRVTPIISPTVEDVEFLGNFTATTTAIHVMHALNGKFSPRVKHYGNTGLLLRGVIDTEATGGFYDDLLDDIGGGHSGYGINVAGPSAGVRVQDNTMSRCRHGFTTIGGSTGFPHNVSVSDNQVHDTTQAGIDTHAAGDDILISSNDIGKSAGAGISIRSRGTRVQNNDIYRCTVHGILLAEDNLSDVTISGNKVDSTDSHGISCAPSCRNLRISGNQLTNIGLDGITLFGSGTIDSTGLMVRDNDVIGYGLAGASRTGILTTGGVGSTGAIISGNNVAPLAGSAAYGIRTLLLTGSAVIDNGAFGTFATASFDAGTNVSLGNKRIDNSVSQIQLDPTAAAIRSIGPNANEDILILPKGTGRLRFGTFTGSADVAINGYVEVRDAGGTLRKLATIA